jgi:hypothetical protein
MRLLLIAAIVPCIATAADPYRVTLRLPPGGLYAQEEAQIEFRIEDTTRPDPLTGFAPLVRARPQAVIDMPGMPGMPRFTETAHAEGIPGDYGIHPTFAHGGEFRLRIAIQPDHSVEFPLTVLDASAHRKRVPPRFTLELTANPKKPKAGEPADLRLAIHDRESDNAIVPSFDVMHEMLMHLIVVRRDLGHFTHEHPALQPDGSFALRYTFASGGEYRLFADVAPRSAGAQILSAPLSVSGKPTDPPPPTPDLVELLSPAQVPTGKTVAVAIRIKDPAHLETYLGAQGHLILIHEDAVTFVHCHPDSVSAAPLVFQARFPKPGRYRAWFQFQRAGQVFTAELGFEAAP